MGSIETEKTTVANFLLRRLKEVGVDDIFGVPGDFVLGFFNEILKSSINYIGTCNELNAAYAADGYARLKGIGCLATTYAVGELSAINGVAGAFAENLSVIQISGVPATRFYRERYLLHHTFGDYEAPYKMYQHVTVAQTILNQPLTIASEIDRVLLACLHYKQPVYIGIPSDMVLEEIEVPKASLKPPKQEDSDAEALQEALTEAVRLLNESKLPILIPGVELQRRGLEKDFEVTLKVSGFPFTTMMLSKAIVNEDHPQFIGLYSGNRSRTYVRERVEKSDCVVILGEKLTDFNTGGFTAMFQKKTSIEVYHDCVRIMNHVYQKVYIHDFLREISKHLAHRNPQSLQIKAATDGCVHRRTLAFTPDLQKRLTMHRFFDRMSHFFEANSVIIAETGASLFSAAEVLLPKKSKFIGQTFYGSIGYTLGATLGACVADASRKVYLFIGDGSFQVTCQDLSTMIRHGCKPIIFLVNNDGYTIERVIVDRPYNDIQSWKYHMITTLFGGKPGFDCYTEGDLEEALAQAQKSDCLTFIEIHLDRWDCNESLRSAGRAMALNNKLLDEIETSAS